MKPITRKELYLNKIVGNNDYEIPEKPITTEEFFFAEILGEAVQAPEPLTRYQMYLAKIAGREIGIPYPETRLERFLAKACGMDIETPTPITREEIFWSNYTAIVEFEVEGVPPLTYKAVEGTLENYRIYGNTVDGESVGDRTENTLPMSTTPISTNIDDFHCEYDGMGTITLTATKDNANFSSFTIPLKEDFIIPISVGQGGNGCLQFNNDKAYFDDNAAAFSLCFNFNNTLIDGWSLLEVNRISYSYIGMGGRTINNISIEKQGQAVLHLSKGDKLTIQPAFYNNGTTEQAPFEPYGYKVPVTVSDGTDTLTTNLYLPEQIRKVGDEAEYIDYGEQKFVKKFYKMTLNFDDMNNDETFPGWSGGTAVVEYCNKIRSLAINTPDGYMPMQRSSISNFKAMFAVNRSILFLGAASSIGHTQSELKEIYAGQSITFILKIPDTDLDVTLPALPTLPGTNVLSVGTEVQPSKVYVKYKGERQ